MNMRGFKYFLRHFVRGMGSVLEIGGRTPQIQHQPSLWWAIGRDFYKVGDDIYFVVTKHSIKEIQHEKRQQEIEDAKRHGQLELELSEN